MVDVDQNRVEPPTGRRRVEPGIHSGHGEEITLHEPVPRVTGQRLGQWQQTALMPLDDRTKPFHDGQRPHPRIIQHGTRRAAEPEPTDHNVETAARQLGQAQPRAPPPRR